MKIGWTNRIESFLDTLEAVYADSKQEATRYKKISDELFWYYNGKIDTINFVRNVLERYLKEEEIE
jgi:hypothetical protein